MPCIHIWDTTCTILALDILVNIICGKIIPLLCEVLHCLQVPQWIQYKVAFLTFHCVRGAAPAYFQHVCIATANLSGCAGLCSAKCGDLTMLRTATKLHKHSFHVTAPVIWNSLPEHLRSHSMSRGQFWLWPTTHLFKQAYRLWEHCILRAIRLDWIETQQVYSSHRFAQSLFMPNQAVQW